MNRLPLPALRCAASCIAAALLACACDRPIVPGPLPANDPSTATKKSGDPAPPAAKNASPPKPQPAAAAPSDAQITARVAAGMRDDPALAGADLSVHTEHGVVSVTGSVRSPDQVAQAEAHAQAPLGVMRVDTRLSMTPP